MQAMLRAPWNTCPAPHLSMGLPSGAAVPAVLSAEVAAGSILNPMILFSFLFHKCSLGLPGELKPWPQSQVDLGLNPATPLASMALGQTHSPLWLSVSLSVKHGVGWGRVSECRPQRAAVRMK